MKKPNKLNLYSIEQLSNNQSIDGVGFNDNETTVLIENNTSGINNIYELIIDDTTTFPLTLSDKESFSAVDYLPGSNKFIYSADSGGNENYHLYLKDKNETEIKDLTPWTNSTNNFEGWNFNKTASYVRSNRRNPKFSDLWKLDTAKWVPTLIFQNDSGFNVIVISKSERYIALTKEITADKTDLYLLDRRKNKMKNLNNSTVARWRAPLFEKNDSIMYYLTNDDNEFFYVVKYNINSGKSEKIYNENCDVERMKLSSQEKYHTLKINRNGKREVLLFDHANNQQIVFPDFNDGYVTGVTFSPSDENLLLSVSFSTCSDNLYIYNMVTKKLKQLTNTQNKEIDQNELVKAEVLRFKSFDGIQIPAIFYKPLDAARSNKVPAIVFVHGGPGDQSYVDYDNAIQFLVNHGYAILLVNHRGSSGYGKKFKAMDNKDHGNGDLKDCIYGKKWLAQQDYIDTSSIGIMGVSYGGCMVLNALVFYPDEFKAGVDLYGISNWLRTLRSFPPNWEKYRQSWYTEMGDPNTIDSIHLKNISPLLNCQKINTPLIIFQGANDVRVLPAESDEIFAAVRKNGVPVEYVKYPDEGHGFRKKENKISTSKRTVEFLDKYLKSKK